MTAEDEERRERLAATAVLLAAKVEKLNSWLAEVNESVEAQAKSTGALDQRAKRHSNWIYATAAGLALSLGACVVLMIVVTGNRERDERQLATIARLEETIVRLDKSVKGQCAFDALMLGSYRPESRPPGPLRDQYEAGFRRMREIYDFVGCTDPILAPAMPR